MTVRVRVKDSGEVELLEKRLGKPDEILQRIGTLLLGRSQRSFRDQKRGDSAWAGRMVPNVPGIVADLNAGGNPKARRFQARPALRDTGRLKSSLTFEVSGNTVAVGTSVPYAALHNEGGTSTVTLTAAGRNKLTALLRRQRGGIKRRSRSEERLKGRIAFSVDEGVKAELTRQLQNSQAKGERSKQLLSLGWLFSKPTFDVNVQKRVFLDITEEDVSDIVKLVEKEVKKRGRS